MTRTVKTADERRAELIQAAQTLFYSKGYESTSVSDIVREVGVAQGTFYYHFDSKTAVLEAIIKTMSTQAQAVLSSVVKDETLPAIAKWRQALTITGNWKLARKQELIEMMRLYKMDENIVLAQKLQAELAPVLAGEYAKIIAQGVAEGVFDTPHIQESAEVCLAIMTTFSESFADLLLHKAEIADALKMAQRKMAAAETAVERILNAPPGSLPILEPETLIAWFD